MVRCEKFGGKPGTLIGKLCRSPPHKENESAGGSLITGGGSKYQSELTVRFTGVCAMPPTFLGPVCETIVAAGPDVPLEVGALLPSDRRRKYEWMQEIKRGLQVPFVHVTYAPGSSVGNLHWIWHSKAADVDSALHAVFPTTD